MHTALTHPLTGEPITPLGFRADGRAIWPIMGASEGGGDGGDGGDDAAQQAAAEEAARKAAEADAAKNKDDLPYPKGKAVADMTPDEQIAYWKFHSQKHENAWKGKLGEYTPEQVAEMEQRIKDIDAASMSDAEKAVAEAYERGKAEASAQAATITVQALIDARKANLDDKDDADIIESLDLLDYTKFITDGSVDSVRLTKVLDRLAPVGGGASTPQWPATGQGKQHTGTGSAKDAGKAEAERRFGKSA